MASEYRSIWNLHIHDAVPRLGPGFNGPPMSYAVCFTNGLFILWWDSGDIQNLNISPLVSKFGEEFGEVNANGQ